MKNNSKGAYFIADDRIINLTIAFLNSFRMHNPDLGLCFIPYNENCDETIKLKEKYGFSVFSDIELLNHYDEISLRFHDTKKGQYRKFAIWQGEFDEFIYIDVDTILLSSLDFVFELLSEYDVLTASSNMPGIVKWVWHETARKSPLLSESQINYGANTGFVASKKSVFSKSQIDAKILEAMPLKEHMNLYCMEQPLLNYVIVSSNINYSSLFKISRKLNSDKIKLEKWAGLKNAEVENGDIKFSDGDSALFLHWAGKWQIYKTERFFNKLLASVGIKTASSKMNVSRFMPYRKLWNYYRYLNE